ncbi:F0F1 ATP synthase subunit epsilon [Bartonella sp. DGB2]|uniref:F0F1 ATP synthase subunit epsilon n=1 Tax=Bartonella sp. DGB2 TaxID=3388426 RepID=UPI0039900728
MAGHFLFELVSPERLLFSEEVTQLVLPASEGYMTVMAEHAPMMTNIIPGLVKVHTLKAERAFAVYGGFAEVTPTSCSLLAEFAVAAEDFDPEDLERRIEEARKAIDGAQEYEARNKAEDFFHQLTTVRGVLTLA